MKRPLASLIATKGAGVVADSYLRDTPPDSLNECMPFYRYQPTQEGAWLAIGSFSSFFRSVLKSWHLDANVQGGSRWAQHGSFEVVRGCLKNKFSPRRKLSPKGVLFQHSGRKVIRVNLSEPLNKVADQANQLGTMTARGGKA